MRILTENLKAYKRVFESVRVTGTYYDYVYLDFKHEKMVFMNETSIVKVNLHIVEKVEGHTPTLYVDGNKFFQLIQNFDYLEVIEDAFHTPKGDIFKLPQLKDSLELPNGRDSSWTGLTVELDDDTTREILAAIDFLEKDPSFPALFFEEDKMIVLSEYRYLEIKKYFEVGGFSIPLPALRILSILLKGLPSETMRFEFKQMENGGFVYYLLYQDMEYQISSSSEVQLPTSKRVEQDGTEVDEPIVHSEEFIASYSHKEFLELDTSSLSSSLRFLNQFTSNLKNSYCKVEFRDQEIAFVVDGEEHIDFKVPVVSYSDKQYFMGNDFWISLVSYLQAVQVFPTKGNVRLHYDVDSTVISLKSSEEEGRITVVQTLVEEPNT